MPWPVVDQNIASLASNLIFLFLIFVCFRFKIYHVSGLSHVMSKEEIRC